MACWAISSKSAQQHADKLMADKGTFRHRQTMAGAVRFSTDELATLASRIAEAARKRAGAGSRRCSTRWSLLALEHGEALSGIADALAVLDVAAALGELAIARALCAADDRRWPGVRTSSAAAIRWWKRRWQAANAGAVRAQ